MCRLVPYMRERDIMTWYDPVRANEHLFQILGFMTVYFWSVFVYLLACAETHLGPEGTRLDKILKPGFKNLFKYAGVVYWNNR